VSVLCIGCLPRPLPDASHSGQFSDLFSVAFSQVDAHVADVTTVKIRRRMVSPGG
jgi:hypothetical protein